MPRSRPADHAKLLARTKSALLVSDEDLGRIIGVSRRTMSRYSGQPMVLLDGQLHQLARAVFPKDRALAEEIAIAGKASLGALGLAPPPPPAAIAEAALARHPLAAELVVSIAAEALNSSPATVRPALLAAFRRARELGLSVQAVEAALAAHVATASAKQPG